MTRALRRLAAAALLACAAVVACATAASAHAELEATDPANGARLDVAPRVATLRFTEPVEVGVGSIRVFDAAGERLDTSNPRHPGGRRSAVEVGLPRLDDGVYVLTWRVVSQDSHPIRGAFTFGVGGADPGATSGLAARLLADTAGSRVVGVTYGFVRGLAFASMIVLLGGTAFVAGLWPDGASDRAVRVLLRTSLGALLVATVLGIGLQGAYAGGLPIADAFRPSVVSDVLQTRFGRTWLARLALLAPAAVVLARLTPARARCVRWRVPAAAVGLAIAVTPGIAGHAAGGRWVGAAVPVDAVHVAASSVWLGGVAVLLVLLRRRSSAAAAVVPRYSQVALACVAAVVATGAFQSLRQVGSVDALTDTTYGRVLMAKLGAFAAVVGLAALSRRQTARRLHADASGTSGARPRTGPVDVRPLRRLIATEAVVAIAVLGLTAVLVETPPARGALVTPFSAEVRAGDVYVDVVVDPPRAGRADVHLYTVDELGASVATDEVTLQLAQPDRGIDPIDLDVTRAGPGHWAAYGAEIPFPGRWRLSIGVRRGEFDLDRATVTVPVR